MTANDGRIGAAILGMYAAICICRDEGIPWEELGRMVEPFAIENERKHIDGEAKK